MGAEQIKMESIGGINNSLYISHLLILIFVDEKSEVTNKS